MATAKSNSEQTDSLLRTKLFIPAPRNDLIRRQRLFDLLQSDLQQEKEFTRKLTLISAPAGYGKTTLASQWLAEADLPVAWLTLETSENDPTRFLTYLVAALQTVSPQIGGSVQAMLQAPQRPPQELILTALINELAAHEGSMVLVLDDYHVIQSPPNHETLNYLVEHLPPNLHLVITSREDPPLALHRLQARRQMLGVRQAELSFEVDEAVTYFQLVSGVSLTPQQADRLTRRTEGWVTGLQLAALSMKSAPNQETFIESFTGSNRYILDYLFEEVFDQQTEEMKSFLLQTAILNRICADLADTITGRSDSQTILEQLEQTNFFIVPLDQSREWYRYHRLFVDLLRHRLSSTSIKLEELHERASRWYAEHSHLEEAIEHALTGEHWDQAGEYINEVSEGSLRRGEITTLLTWCRRMPEEVLLGRPDWALTYAWPLILIGEAEEADRVLQHLKQMVPAGSDALQGQIAAAEAFLSRAYGDMTKTIELSKKALSLLPEDDRSSRGNVAVNLGLNAWHLGLLDDAESALKDALADTQATRNHYAHHTALVFMARTIASHGDLKEAVQIVEAALQMGDRIPTAVLAHCDVAAIYFERNQLDSAWKHQEQATAIAEAIHNMEFKSACCVQRALFHLGLNQVYEAKAALEPALAFSRTQDIPPLTLARIKSCQVQLALAGGDLSEARETLASIPLPHDAGTFTRFIDLNTARLLLAEGNKAKAREMLQAAHKQATKSGWGYALQTIRVLQALAADDLDDGINHLQSAIETGEAQDFLRVFLNEGEDVVELLHETARRGIAPTYVGSILAVIGVPADTSPKFEGLLEPLTERELEVLRLVAAGLSNRQIAEQLVVSLGTAKSHIHHIFGKLDVSSRTEAAARARDLGLI